MFRVSNGRSYLCELLNRVPDLLVKNPPVGDDDDRIEYGRAIFSKAAQLMCKPRNRV